MLLLYLSILLLNSTTVPINILMLQARQQSAGQQQARSVGQGGSQDHRQESAGASAAQ